MGCASSIPKKYGAIGRRRKRFSKILDVVVFTPSLRAPVAINLVHPLKGLVPRELLEKISQLRGRIVLLAEENVLAASPGVLELQRALEEYLSVLLGLTEKEHQLAALVEFKWRSLGDDAQETGLASVRYEVLSVIHMAAMLYLLEANLLLIQKDSPEIYERKVSEDPKKAAVDLLLKASGCLDYCVQHILVHLPQHIRKDLPEGLQQGVLEAISVQALAQGVEMQLALAIECEKATLSVKRRLACEEVSYFAQAQYCLSGCNNNDANGKKLLLFLKYKYLEAKAAAYYYHGLVVGKSNSPDDQISSVCCSLAADELLMESKRACLSFCLAAPVTRLPQELGLMKYLHKKIPDLASKKSQMYGYLLDEDKALLSLPDLPEFPLSLKPDGYNLPEIDTLWGDKSCQPQVQSLKEHLKDEDDELQSE